jgi:hypothetical protein
MSAAHQRLREGDVVMRRYRVKRKIGEGSFSEVFLAVDEDDSHGGGGDRPEVALKAAKADCPPGMMTGEARLSARLSEVSPLTPRYLGQGHFKRRHRSGAEEVVDVIVLGVLGESISDVRKGFDAGYFPLYEGVQAAIGMLRALRALHQAGYVHRDVKPSNFLLSHKARHANGDEWRCYAIDFGLTRMYKKPDTDELVPARADGDAGFRGTSLYASLRSHRKCELGPVDDIWSMLFVTIDMLTNSLPWKTVATRARDRDRPADARSIVERMKAACVEDPSKFPGLEGLEGLRHIMRHLNTLGYGDEPDYGAIESWLMSVAETAHAAPGEYPINSRASEMLHHVRELGLLPDALPASGQESALRAAPAGQAPAARPAVDRGGDHHVAGRGSQPVDSCPLRPNALLCDDPDINTSPAAGRILFECAVAASFMCQAGRGFVPRFGRTFSENRPEISVACRANGCSFFAGASFRLWAGSGELKQWVVHPRTDLSHTCTAAERDAARGKRKRDSVMTRPMAARVMAGLKNFPKISGIVPPALLDPELFSAHQRKRQRLGARHDESHADNGGQR